MMVRLRLRLGLRLRLRLRLRLGMSGRAYQQLPSLSGVVVRCSHSRQVNVHSLAPRTQAGMCPCVLP